MGSAMSAQPQKGLMVALPGANTHVHFYLATMAEIPGSAQRIEPGDKTMKAADQARELPLGRSLAKTGHCCFSLCVASVGKPELAYLLRANPARASSP